MDNCDGASAIQSSQEIKFHIATAFARMSFLSGLNEKILERREQERTEPAAIGVSVLQPVTFQYLHKKILREVLRVLR